MVTVVFATYAEVFTGVATAMIVDLAPEDGRARAVLPAACVNLPGRGLGPVLAGTLLRGDRAATPA